MINISQRNMSGFWLKWLPDMKRPHIHYLHLCMTCYRIMSVERNLKENRLNQLLKTGGGMFNSCLQKIAPMFGESLSSVKFIIQNEKRIERKEYENEEIKEERNVVSEGV